jgi:3'-phosphoadenosine 5'-phosphosulfate sulfotransferase (PAPS reductase)/FAD synthetase
MNIQTLIADPTVLFAINHSGGKDSQAMMIELLKIIPASRLVVAHADLGEVEHHGTQDHARQQADAAGVPFLVCRATKTLLDMVERRFASRPGVPSWPSSQHRQCTSDLKRDPINRDLKAYMGAHGYTKVVSCQGIRAAESVSRAKKNPFKPLSREHGVAGREWYEWYPIFDRSTAWVFETIVAAGQELHWAYKAGNERLSCVFCIFGSPTDIAVGAKHRPELAAKYIALEAKTGYTMHVSQRPLEAIIAEGMALLN